MRTTVTLEADVAQTLKRLRRARNATLKSLVNEALRHGLRDMSAPPKKRPVVRTKVFHLGKPLITIDNVAEALAHLEGEGSK